MCCCIDSLYEFEYLYFRTLPFNEFVRRAAEVKHKEYFLSEVTSLVSQLLLLVFPVYGGKKKKKNFKSCCTKALDLRFNWFVWLAAKGKT